MSRRDLMRLFLLGAIWGGSFIFMRLLAPAIGAFMTVELRLLLAGIALFIGFKATGFDFGWRVFWKKYFITGAVNSALPFCLYAYAALHISASSMAILNSSTPLFGVVFSALWLGEKLTGQKIAGLVMGSLGVALVARAASGGSDIDGEFIPAVLACLGGSACYAIAGIYIKKFAADVKPVGMAACSQLAAAVILLPSFLHFPPLETFTPVLIGSVLVLSLVCSAIAYLLYFGLIASAGPSKALTVTFLVPAFGMVWGGIFLHETVTLPMLAGCALIIAGTACVIGLFTGKKAAAPSA